jgi:two-component system chemotaxis response regulator CheY
MQFLDDPDGYKLARILYAVSANPESWHGWSALVLRLSAEEDSDLVSEGFSSACAVFTSFLRGVDGHAYLDLSSGQICVLCRSIPKNVLKESGAHIATLLSEENKMDVTYRVFSMEEDALDLAADAIRMCPGATFRFENEVSPKEKSGYERQTPPFEGCAENRSDLVDLGDLGGVKVLLVEDDPVTRWMVRNTLRDECRFASAANASQACSLYASYRPDVVFLDIHLPDKNGHTVLDWIMRNDPGACVIMFSSDNDLENISESLEDGAKGFIAKPFRRESLLKYVRGN